MDRLVECPWPGNVRELENVVERSMTLSPGSSLIAESLLVPVEMRSDVPEAKHAGIEGVMRGYILGVLGKCHWRIKDWKQIKSRQIPWYLGRWTRDEFIQVRQWLGDVDRDQGAAPKIDGPGHETGDR